MQVNSYTTEIVSLFKTNIFNNGTCATMMIMTEINPLFKINICQ